MPNNEVQLTKVITGKVRASYAHVFTPEAIEEGSDKKYSLCLLIPKSDKKTLDAVKKAIEAAKEAGKATKFAGKIPANLKLPLRDGDFERPELEEYQGHWFVNATSKTKPGVVDKDLNPILDQDEFYSGCFCRASISFFAFNTSGNKGIACGLNNVQKLADGPALGGRASAEADFGDAPVEDDDLM